MDFSGSIDWNPLEDRIKETSWCLTEEMFERFTFKASISDKVKKSGVSFQDQSNSAGKAVTQCVYPEPRIPYPRISDLSIEDQKFFLDTYKEFLTGKDIGFVNINRLQNLVWMLNSEQEEFSLFLQHHSLLLKDQYNFLQPHVMESILKLLNDQKACVQDLPPCYTLFQTVGLSTGAVFPNDPILCFVCTLKQEVGRPLLSLPDLQGNQINLVKNTEDKGGFLLQAKLCQDTTASSLAKEHGVHFVLTADALQTLIDNHQPDYEKEWELPVTVSEYSKDCNEATSNCLKLTMIDDPLPAKSIAPREMNVMFYQREVCRLLENVSSKGNNDLLEMSDLTQISSVSMQEAVVTENNIKLEKNKGNHSETINDVHCSNHENLGQMQGKCVCVHAESNVSKAADNDVNSRNDKNTLDNSDRPLKKNELNFSYSVWTFGNIKLLIRSRTTGLLYQPNRGGKGSLHAANVYVKPEYQLMFGYERLTLSEASRWWFNCYVSPDSVCVCARVNPVSENLVRFDVLNQASILSLSSFNPAQPMKMIHSILSRLEKLLKPGQFVLSHASKDMHTCIYEMVSEGKSACDVKKALYDLHALHFTKGVFLTNYEKTVPWVSIDSNMFLEWHVENERLPLTFPAVSSEQLKKIKEVKINAGKKKKGKKNKKKQEQKVAVSNNKDKGNVNRNFFNTRSKFRNQRKNVDELVHLDWPVGGLKTETTNAQTDTERLSQRLRSRSKPVTYDGIEFDF